MNTRWIRRCPRHLRTGFGIAVLLLAALPASAQQPAAAYFRTNCSACHSIGGGRLVGPDLEGVAQRKDRPWLLKWLQNPQAVIDSGDVYAQQLVQGSNGIVMPTIPSLDTATANAVLDFIEAQSKSKPAAAAAPLITDRPFTPQDVAIGRQIFLGYQSLAGSGPACSSCHTVKGLGGLSGGRLGPDLTLVYERLQGRAGLSAWLSSPASPTMAPVFRTRPLQPQEILPLVAFFADTAKKGGADDSTALLNFFLLGMGVMVVGLVSLDAIWKKRIHGVRRQIVGRRSRGEDE